MKKCIKWLIDKRLEVAYHKIAEERQRPSDIYWELGFETLAHFSRKFKEKYHMSPSQLKGVDFLDADIPTL